jgi:hypothetical protein
VASKISVLPVDLSILDVIQCDIPSHIFAQQILDHIDPPHASCSTRQCFQVDNKKFKWHNQFLYYIGHLYVPNGLV